MYFERKTIHDSLHDFGKFSPVCQVCVGFNISSLSAVAASGGWALIWELIVNCRRWFFQPSSGSVTHKPLDQIENWDGNQDISIAVAVFVVIFVEFDQYWDEQACIWKLRTLTISQKVRMENWSWIVENHHLVQSRTSHWIGPIVTEREQSQLFSIFKNIWKCVKSMPWHLFTW